MGFNTENLPVQSPMPIFMEKVQNAIHSVELAFPDSIERGLARVTRHYWDELLEMCPGGEPQIIADFKLLVRITLSGQLLRAETGPAGSGEARPRAPEKRSKWRFGRMPWFQDFALLGSLA